MIRFTHSKLLAASVLLLALAGSCRPQRTNDTIKVVSPDGTGDYTCVQDAFDDVPEGLDSTQRWIIKLKPGKYYEKVILRRGKNHVVLMGENAENTILYYDDYAGSGTAQPKQSTTIEADDFTAVGITFLNPHQNIREKPGENSHSQATALSVTGDRLAFYNCRMVGNQDTFWGRGNGRVYVRKCYVEGNVDYIYGNSVMVFDGCEIFSNQHESYITAASTLPETRFGITFLDCRLSAKEVGQPDHDGVPFEYFYLGRPWHNTSKVAFIRCYEPSTVHPDGWTVMNPKAIPMFYEYRCTGPGAEEGRLANRKMGGSQLSDEQAAEYTVENIFAKSTNPTYEKDWKPLKDFAL